MAIKTVKRQNGSNYEMNNFFCGGHTIHPPIGRLFSQLVLNPHHSEIRPPKYLDYRYMPLQSATNSDSGNKVTILESLKTPVNKILEIIHMTNSTVNDFHFPNNNNYHYDI